MHLKWLYLVSLWHGGVHVWSLRRGVTGYSAEEGESRPRASFFGHNYAFVLLNKSFKINTHCFRDVLVFDDEMLIATRCKRACSIARHTVTVKHGHSQWLLHVYTKKERTLVVWFIFWAAAAVVMCFVWMYLHFPFLIFAYYVCQLCFCLSVSLVGKFTLSARETFTVSNWKRVCVLNC